MICGIYSITNQATGKLYIGSSSDVNRRLKEHFRLLSAGRHKNKKLQHSFLKHGPCSLVGKLELVCEEANKYLYEQILIDGAGAVISGYNINPVAERGYSRPLEELSTKFFSDRSFIDDNGCRVFSGALDGNGMAKVKRSGISKNLHILAYEYFVGNVPDGMSVFRTCKNRACVNPFHLRVGKRSDICKHAFATGRIHPRGNKALTEEQVRQIKISSETNASIGKHYGVSETTIRNIRHGKTWKHVLAEGVTNAVN